MKTTNSLGHVGIHLFLAAAVVALVGCGAAPDGSDPNGTTEATTAESNDVAPPPPVWRAEEVPGTGERSDRARTVAPTEVAPEQHEQSIAPMDGVPDGGHGHEGEAKYTYPRQM